MVPVVLIIFEWMGVAEDQAIKLAFGTSLAAVFVTAIGSSYAHHRHGTVWWKASIPFGSGGAAGALLGSTITTQFLSAGPLRIAFGVILLAASLRLIFGEAPKVEGVPRGNVLVWGFTGFAVGVVSGLIGIGGGILFVPLMTLVFSFGIHRSVGTSAGSMLFISAAGALGYVVNGLGQAGLPQYSVGFVYVPAWLLVASASVIISPVGARIAHRLTARMLTVAFVIIMVYLGLRMIGVFDWLGLPL